MVWEEGGIVRRTLSTGVAPLGGGGVEETVLLAEGLVAGARVRVLGLGGHVGIGDLGDVDEEEDGGEQEDEDADGEVDPLHALERVDVVARVLEEDVGAQHGADDGADGLDGLGQVDAQLRVLGRADDGHEGVRGRLQRAQARADDDRGAAEAAKGAVEPGGPHAQGADAVEDQAQHEGGLVAIMAERPVGEAERGEGVGAGILVSLQASKDGVEQKYPKYAPCRPADLARVMSRVT